MPRAGASTALRCEIMLCYVMFTTSSPRGRRHGRLTIGHVKVMLAYSMVTAYPLTTRASGPSVLKQQGQWDQQ